MIDVLPTILDLVGLPLPEIRQEKVCSARLQIANGDYELEPVLDEALDRVLEEFIAEI